MALEYIKEDRCDGCGVCIESCPADVLRLEKRRTSGSRWIARIAYPEDCHACLLCLLDCPRNAIRASAYLEPPPGWFPYELSEEHPHPL